MRDINTVRKAVATMANQLHKLGYSLSQAFKTAWKRVKYSMKCRVAGVTYEKRQQLLQFIAGRKHEDLTVYLKRDRANTFDKNAVAVVIGISNVGYAHIGYLPADIFLYIEPLVFNAPASASGICKFAGIFQVYRKVCQPLECEFFYFSGFFLCFFNFQRQQRQAVIPVINFRHPFHMEFFVYLPFPGVFPGYCPVQAF